MALKRNENEAGCRYGAVLVFSLIKHMGVGRSLGDFPVAAATSSFDGQYFILKYFLKLLRTYIFDGKPKVLSFVEF